MIYFSELNEEHKPVAECPVLKRHYQSPAVIIGSEECVHCAHFVAFTPVVAEGHIVRGKIAVKCSFDDTKPDQSQAEPFDPINPNYYKKGFGIECIDVTKHFNFCRGNAMKYLWRAGEKNADKEIEDLKKALWYLECEIKRLSDDKS